MGPDAERELATICNALVASRGLLTETDAARLIGKSKRHVRYLCLELTGKGFRATRLAIKLSHARELVHTTALPIPDIAEQLGYESGRAKFEGAYKRHYGRTPTVDRRDKASLVTAPEPAATA